MFQYAVCESMCTKKTQSWYFTQKTYSKTQNATAIVYVCGSYQSSSVECNWNASAFSLLPCWSMNHYTTAGAEAHCGGERIFYSDSTCHLWRLWQGHKKVLLPFAPYVGLFVCLDHKTVKVMLTNDIRKWWNSEVRRVCFRDQCGPLMLNLTFSDGETPLRCLQDTWHRLFLWTLNQYPWEVA